jgi:hypothetical protein
MKAKKYDKVNTLPDNAIKVSAYAESIGQKNPAYICIMYDRYLTGKGSQPSFKIVNWQDINFVIPE